MMTSEEFRLVECFSHDFQCSPKVIDTNLFGRRKSDAAFHIYSLEPRGNHSQNNEDSKLFSSRYVHEINSFSTQNSTFPTRAMTKWMLDGTTYLACVHENSTIEIFDSHGNSIKEILKAHDGFIQLLTRFGDYLVSGTNLSIRLWKIYRETNTENNQQMTAVQRHRTLYPESPIYAFLSYQNFLIGARWDGMLQKWNQNFVNDCTTPAHDGPVRALCEWKDHVVSASSDKLIKLWTIENTKLKHAFTLNGHEDEVHCLCTWNDFLCSGSGREEWMGPATCEIRIWDFSGNCIHVAKRHQNPLRNLFVWNANLCSLSWDEFCLWKSMYFVFSPSLTSTSLPPLEDSPIVLGG